MPTYTFRKVPHQAAKSVPCTICGKKVRRQRTFFQTLNPFNKNDQGLPKTELEIVRELDAQATRWHAEPETHPKCESEAVA
ncbi:hypothetical protein [Streptomyces sp. KL116D]|uniref:hypothetical protein n=1 Tax=Streptomyces sp. KL116D TaxID=3045152 RepID=UPI003555DEB4